jgi:RNA polymerase sigma factor (TIGR02999 family)
MPNRATDFSAALNLHLNKRQIRFKRVIFSAKIELICVTICAMEEQSNDPAAITLLLGKWRQGDSDAFEKIARYVYDELRRRASAYMRNERSGHTLQTTGLVHEAFIKLMDKRELVWDDRNHFLAVASQAMRRILVDHARNRKREKRGGEFENLPLDEVREVKSITSDVDLVALDEALNNLATFDKRQAQIVELKYFGGMTLDETAEVLGVSRVTVKRDWNIAKAWLKQQLQE